MSLVPAFYVRSERLGRTSHLGSESRPHRFTELDDQVDGKNVAERDRAVSELEWIPPSAAYT